MTLPMREMHAEMLRSRQTEVEVRPGLPPIRAYRLDGTPCISCERAADWQYEHGYIWHLGARVLGIVIHDLDSPYARHQWIAIVGSTETAHDEARHYLALKLGLGEEVADDAVPNREG